MARRSRKWYSAILAGNGMDDWSSLYVSNHRGFCVNVMVHRGRDGVADFQSFALTFQAAPSLLKWKKAHALCGTLSPSTRFSLFFSANQHRLLPILSENNSHVLL